MNLASVLSLIGIVLTAIATASSSAVQEFWAGHSTAAPVLLALWGAASHFLPSPAADKKPEL